MVIKTALEVYMKAKMCLLRYELMQEPDRLANMKAQWEAWQASMPPIPEDATISLGFSVKDMPQR